ncbi:hypothetical protein SK128_021565, partial [Halocaridina rubra]
DIEKQQCTGQTVDCATFPLCAHFTVESSQFDQVVKRIVFDLEIWVFSNISGLVVLDGAGKISDYNHNFTRLLFGYGKRELQGEAITHLIPTFFDDVALIQKMNSPSFETDHSDTATSDIEPYSQKENSKRTGENAVFLKSSLGSALNSEQSSVITPNRAFILTNSGQDSVFGSMLNSTSSCSKGDKTDADLQINKAMRDITNSINVLNISPQNVSSQTNTSSLQSTPSRCNQKVNEDSTPIKSLPK